MAICDNLSKIRVANAATCAAQKAQRATAVSYTHLDVYKRQVRTQRKSVEKFAKSSAWDRLHREDFEELALNVSGLPSELVDDDEDAKRFDLLVLRTQLAILQARPDLSSLREKMQAIARALEDQDAIPAIKAQMALIQDVAGQQLSLIHI